MTDDLYVEKKLISVTSSKITGKVCTMAAMSEDKNRSEMYSINNCTTEIKQKHNLVIYILTFLLPEKSKR